MSFVDDLIARLNDIEKRLRHEEKLDKNPTPGGYGLLASANTWTANNAFNSTATSGTAFSVTRNLTAASTDSPVVSILQDHASDDQPALKVTQDGTGAIAEFYDAATRTLAILDGGEVRVNNAAATSAFMRLAINDVVKALIGAAVGTDALITGTTAGDLAIRTVSGRVLLSTDDGTTAHAILTVLGRLGLGTVAPALLANASSKVVHVYQNDTDGAGVRVQSSNTSAEMQAGNAFWRLYSETAAPLYIYTNSNIRMALLSTGEVFIGVTSGGASRLGIQPGTSSNDAAVGGVLYVDSGSYANGTTVETTLATYALPANSLSANNMSIAVSAWGTITNAAATKTLKFYFGATVVTLISGGSGTPATWTMHARVIRTGAATQDILVEAVGTGLTPVTITTAAETLSGAITVKMTGQGGASSQVLQEGMIIEWLDANT